MANDLLQNFEIFLVKFRFFKNSISRFSKLVQLPRYHGWKENCHLHKVPFLLCSQLATDLLHNLDTFLTKNRFFKILNVDSQYHGCKEGPLDYCTMWKSLWYTIAYVLPNVHWSSREFSIKKNYILKANFLNSISLYMEFFSSVY